MIRKIDSEELTTRIAAQKKYSNNYIGMVFIEQNPADFENDRGYVLYLMETEEEQFQIPRETEDGRYISIMSGHGPFLGGLRMGAAEIGQWSN